VSPSYRPFKPARLTTVRALAARIHENPIIEGLTCSGGEPFHQAQGLANLIGLIHRQRPELTILVYSGYTLSQLKSSRLSGVTSLLSRLDTLIDGPYFQQLDNGQTGIRGSSNQTIHHFTPRLKHFDFEATPRMPEIHILDRELVFVGVPSSRFSKALDRIKVSITEYSQRLIQDVRS
jgi:anaerobic ribonucleoside-triphosphate reductase activating protein